MVKFTEKSALADAVTLSITFRHNNVLTKRMYVWIYYSSHLRYLGLAFQFGEGSWVLQLDGIHRHSPLCTGIANLSFSTSLIYNSP